MQSFNPAFIEDEEEQTIIIKKEQDDIVDEEFFQSKDLSEMEEALLLFDIERLCEIHYVLSKEEIKSLIESHVLQFLIQLTENNDITTDDLLFKYNFTVNCNNSFNENNNDEETVNNEEVSSLKPYMVDQNLFSSSKKKTSEFIIQTSNTIYTLKKDKQQNSYNSSKKQKLNSASNTGYSCGLAVGGLRKNYLVWKLLCDVYQLQILQKKITQRELFYMNVSFFNDQIQCNNYIDNICNILKLDRTLLNIVTMGKGLIYSNDGKNNSIVNITPNISQQSIIENIPGDLEYLENNVTFCNEFCKDNNNCKNVTLLIIEKECIFKRLIEDKIYKFIPNIILITGCGFPSLTTRYLCHLITKKFNTCNLKVFGLFDFNIYGFQILNNYKYGSIALSKHVTSQTSTIGEKLQWLGLRYNDIKDIPAMYNQKVTNRELQYIEKHLKYHQLKMSSNTTIPSNKDNYNSYQSIITELEKMKTCKYEIEIIANIHGIDKMGIYFAKKIVSYNDKYYGQYLIPMDDNCVYYMDDEGDKQMVVVSIKNEYKELINLRRIKFIHSELECTFIVMEDDTVWVAGNNSNYQLGLGHNNPLTQIPTKITTTLPQTEKIKKISILQHSTIFLMESGNVYVCGRDYYNDYKSNSEQNKHNFKVPTLILQNILNISFDTQFYVLFENHFNELLVSGVVTNDIIGLKLKDLSHLYNTKPIYFPGLKSLKSPRVNISNNNSSTSTNSNNSNGSSNGHLSTSVTSLKLNQSKLKISCNLRSIMILSMNTNTIYVYGENSNGKFGINTKDDIFGELYINEFFKNYKVTITDIQNSDTCCYFLSNENQVYLSGNGSLIPVKILHSHFVTKLLPNNLFIADRGKYINRDGEITLRYVYKYYSENFFLMDHFDFIVEGKIVTVFKSALYPMDKFSKVKLLDETFLHHLISDKKITFKKLSDFFYSQSMLDLVNGEYDLKNLEFYFKASFDAYNANELQLQKARLDKFVKSQHIYNTDILTLVVKKMKEFMDMYHVNITTNMDFLFVYLYAVGFFQHSMKEDFLLFEMLEIAFNNNLTIFIEPFILYLEDNLLHTTEINVNNLQFEIPKNYEELKNILMSSCFESSSNNNANNNTNSLNLSNNNHNSTSINGTRRGSNASDILSSIRHNRYSDVGEVAPVSSFLSFDSSVLTTNTPNNHSPQTSPSQPQKLFDKLFSNNKSPTTIGAIPPLIIAFVFSFSLLAAAKLLLKCDRVKNADSKISKDETIVLQTVMEDMKIMIEEDLKKQEFIAAMQKRKKKDFQPLIKFANEKMWNYGKEIIKNLPNFTKGNEVCILFKYLTLNVLQQEPKWLKEITKHTFCNGKYVVLKRIAGGAEGNIYLCIVDKKVMVVDNNNNNNATTSTTTTSTALPSFNNNGGSSTSSLVRIGNNINNVVNYSQMVAVKKLTENLDKESVEVLKWQIEQVTSMSNHPNICPYIDYQIDEKGDGEYSATMVMPYFELGTLYSKVLEYKQKNLKIQNWLDLALQISNGLQQLHYKNLIFRDLKSDNILLEKSEDGKEICKIADFGLMKSHDLYDTDFSVKGTPSTLAPECTDGSFRIEKASDIFSLGCVIFELITLENQIVKNNTQSKLQTKFLMHEAVKTDEQGTQIILCKMMKKNQIPELIQRLVISMIQYHPLKRPSIDSVIDVLRTVQSGNSKLIEECTVRYDQVLLPLITKVKKQSKKVANFLKKFNESFIANGRFRIEETKTLNNLTSYKCTDLENRDLVIIRCCKFLSDFTLQIAKYQTYKHIYLASIYDQFIWNENYYYSILYKPTLFDLINTKLQNKSFFTEIEIVKIGTQLIELIYFLQKRQLLHKHLTISTIMTNKLSENCNDFDITVTDLEYLKDVQENLREEYYEKKKFILTDELQEEIIQEWFQKDIKTIGIILCQCMTLNINPLLTSFTNSNNNNNEELTTLLRKYNNYSDKLIQFILKLSTTTSLPSHIVQLKTEFNLYSQQLGIQFPSPFHITTTKSPRRRTLEILNELQLQE